MILTRWSLVFNNIIVLYIKNKEITFLFNDLMFCKRLRGKQSKNSSIYSKYLPPRVQQASSRLSMIISTGIDQYFKVWS